MPPIAADAIKKVLGDVAERHMSQRENFRVGTAAAHALNRIYERRLAGEEPRKDPFFQSLEDDRSPAETALDGMLYQCRDQWEEKKIPWIANIYANAVFSETPPEIINLVIVRASQMTWRQLCIFALAGREIEPKMNTDWIMETSVCMVNYREIFIAEALELLEGQYRLLQASPFTMTALGRFCFTFMSLEDFSMDELTKIAFLFPSNAEARPGGQAKSTNL